MAVSLLPDQVDDLVRLTLENARKKNWTDVSLPNQKYFFGDRFIKGKKKPVKGGTEQTWVLQTDTTNTFQWTGLFGTDTTDVRNLSVKGSQKWAMARVNFSYDVNESDFQGNELEIVSSIKMRENAMYGEWFKNMEAALWTAPTSSSEDPRKMSGIPFWIQKNATEGFNGGDPSGFSSGAGDIATGTYSGWKNYTYTYGQVTEDDFVQKTCRAISFTNFQPPNPFPNAVAGEPDWALYTTYRLLSKLKRYLNARNDNLKDVAGIYAGATPFEGIPVYWVPEMEHSTQAGYDATDPLYGVNWKTIEFYFQTGMDMVKHKAYQPDRQPTVRVVPMMSTLNMLCRNRRANFVGYSA